MQNQTVIERGTTQTGSAVKLVKRGSKFDVVKVNASALNWVYVAKQVSEQAARNEFFPANGDAVKRGDKLVHKHYINEDKTPAIYVVTRTTFHGIYYRPVDGGSPVYCTIEEANSERYFVKMLETA